MKKFDKKELKEILYNCCGSVNWVNEFALHFPFESKEKMFEKAEEIWFGLKRKDWLEAFKEHPKVGDFESLQKKFGGTKDSSASIEKITEFIKYNKWYEKDFGFKFIVCGDGKSANEMLSLIKKRVKNNYEEELKIAMAEQNKITKLKLEKLF